MLCNKLSHNHSIYQVSVKKNYEYLHVKLWGDLWDILVREKVNVHKGV